MYVVVAYDIADDRRRARVMKALRGYGEHVQESVFECDLDEAAFRRMAKQLRALIDAASDNIRFYLLCAQDVERIEQMGVDRPVQLAKEMLLI